MSTRRVACSCDLLQRTDRPVAEDERVRGGPGDGDIAAGRESDPGLGGQDRYDEPAAGPDLVRDGVPEIGGLLDAAADRRRRLPRAAARSTRADAELDLRPAARRRPSTGTSSPVERRTAPPASTVPRRRLVVPMKSATNRVVGRSYSSSGVPSCSTLPWFMIAIRSLIVSASSWSWVTYTNVIPTSTWMRLSSSCRLRRSLRSSAPSGSSRSSTVGRLTRARASATRCCWPPDSWCGLRRS